MIFCSWLNLNFTWFTILSWYFHKYVWLQLFQNLNYYHTDTLQTAEEIQLHWIVKSRKSLKKIRGWKIHYYYLLRDVATQKKPDTNVFFEWQQKMETSNFHVSVPTKLYKPRVYERFAQFFFWASCCYPLLGRSRSRGRCWAANQLSHQSELSDRVVHGEVNGLDIRGQHGRRSVPLRHTHRPQRRPYPICTSRNGNVPHRCGGG